MAWSSDAWARIARSVGARAGLALERDTERVESVFADAARDAGLNRDAFAELVADDPERIDALVDALTIGETYFFRDPGHFEFLRKEIIPDVLDRRGSDHAFRAWSAGCASGEEAWSLAILFAREGLENARVIATDVSRPALEKARRATYGQWSFRGEMAALADPFLEREGNARRVPAGLRSRVEFERHNLALDALPSLARGLWGFDVIFCRNVLLYLSREKVTEVFRSLHACLADGGWLIVGPSDPTPVGFEAVLRGGGVFYRRNDGLAREPVVRIVSQPPQATIPRASAQETRVRPAPPSLKAQPPPDATLEVRTLANTDERAAERLCATLRARAPDSIELSYLHAVLLLALGRVDDAIRVTRQVLYLDRSLAVGHFLLGSALLRRGDAAAARRSFSASAALAASLAPDEPVPLADGETAGRFRHAAASQVVLLDATEGSSR